MAKQAAKKPAAKKAEAPIIEEQVQVKETVVAKEEKKDTWEIKDRMYYLTKNVSPLTYRLQAKHAMHRPMMWFDEEQGYQRELRYATNKRSPFVDEQEGPVTLGHIVFQNGTLFVPKQQQALQKLLSLYHPALNKKYKEQDKAAEAVDDLDFFEMELEAMSAAKDMEIDHAKAIIRVEIGSAVSKMSSKEIKRALASIKPPKKKPTLPKAPWDDKEQKEAKVDELSMGKMQAYGKAAAKDIDKHRNTVKGALDQPASPKKAQAGLDAMKGLTKRSKGSDMYVDKMTGRSKVKPTMENDDEVVMNPKKDKKEKANDTTMAQESALPPIYARIMEARGTADKDGKHYAKAADQEDWNENEKNNKGAMDMKKDHEGPKMDDPEQSDQMTKAANAAPNAAARKGDNAAGDKKIIPSATPTKGM